MNYTVVGVLGQGGFGKVEKIQWQDGSFSALKTFSLNQAQGFPPPMIENVRRRFIREAKVQSGIKHKNIVPVTYKDLTSNPPKFAMPLAKGSLQDEIQRDRTLNGTFMTALMDIIAGLQEIHFLEIIHRDLKPANVLRFTDSSTGNDYYAIGDFGLMSIDESNITQLTQPGMQMGSGYYTAPEIVKDLKHATYSSDIYSLGCILHAFVGQQPRVPCNEINEPGDFGGIMLACTRNDPRRRFKSVSAVRDAILSIKDVKLPAHTQKGAEVISTLDKTDLTNDEWEQIVNFIQDNFGTPDSSNALHRLSLAHLDNMIKDRGNNSLSSRLGLLYAEWIRDGSFSFEECDGLAIRLERFITACSVNVQAECIMSMLFLGTNHNRWFVERRFANWISPSIDVTLARRLAVEFRADDDNVCKAIKHLERSIGYKRTSFHPEIVQVLAETCI